MSWHSVRELELTDKTVFLRLDLNVPVSDGAVTDTARIDAVLPTLGLCLKSGAKVVAASHLGRPKGRPDPALSLQPVAEKLQTLLGWPVRFCSESVGPHASAMKEDLEEGDLLLLENLRFSQGETSNDPEFAAGLASGCDLYATDAFGTLHRAHASVVGVPRVLGNGAAGLLVERELQVLSRVLEAPAQPMVLILGGAKISTKMPVLRNLLPKCDKVLLGGAMALTVLAARGEEMGDSLVESSAFDIARELEELAEKAGAELLLPVDHRIETPDGSAEVCKSPVPSGCRALDIGPESVERYLEAIPTSGTILWNGPLGFFEKEAFAGATLQLGRAVADSAADSIVGGGDSVAALNRLGLASQIDHVSTGGGAMLEYLSGTALPGIEAIR